jgi:hypothetical protein
LLDDASPSNAGDGAHDGARDIAVEVGQKRIHVALGHRCAAKSTTSRRALAWPGNR